MSYYIEKNLLSIEDNCAWIKQEVMNRHDLSSEIRSEIENLADAMKDLCSSIMKETLSDECIYELEDIDSIYDDEIYGFQHIEVIEDYK